MVELTEADHEAGLKIVRQSNVHKLIINSIPPFLNVDIGGCVEVRATNKQGPQCGTKNSENGSAVSSLARFCFQISSFNSWSLWWQEFDISKEQYNDAIFSDNLKLSACLVFILLQPNLTTT